MQNILSKACTKTVKATPEEESLLYKELIEGLLDPVSDRRLLIKIYTFIKYLTLEK